MATDIAELTLKEFRTQYNTTKPRYEYWFGKAIQKSVPTTAHGVLQFLLMLLFHRYNYATGSEIELRLDPEWQPKPDVIADRHGLETPYPTHPFDLVAEILSPDDRLERVTQKCAHYHRLGIRQILVFDPIQRVAWKWSGSILLSIETLAIADPPVSVRILWDQLDEQLLPTSDV